MNGKPKQKHFDLDLIIAEKIAQANKSAIGKIFNSFAVKTGGASTLAFLNIIGTATLGFIVTYPLYLVGGFYAALPTTLVTTLPILVIFIAIVTRRFRFLEIRPPMKLLLLAIFFSLPFGILSLPLLHKISSARCKARSKAK